jgi:transcriptional regulator with XRE-family HTH domain
MEFSIEQYREKLAKAVRDKRRAADLSQKRLGELSGVSERTILNIETSNYNSMTLTTLQAVTKALGITVKMVLSGGTL